MKPAAPDVHAVALRDAVQAVVGSRIPVHLDEVPADPGLPYVVVWSDSAISSTESVGGRNELGTFHPSLTVAGQDALQVRLLRGRLEGLYERDVIVADRLLEVEKLAADAIQRDDDIPDRLVYWCRDQLEVRSYAA